MSSSFPESSTDLPLAGGSLPPTGPAFADLPAETGFDWELIQAQAQEEASCRQLICRQLEGQREIVQATLSLDWAVGQLVAVAHLPLVPPLAQPPQVQAELAEGLEARLRITDRQPFGIRVEVTLPAAAAQATRGHLHLVVVSQPAD